jgi:hypothetical protein
MIQRQGTPPGREAYTHLSSSMSDCYGIHVSRLGHAGGSRCVERSWRCCRQPAGVRPEQEPHLHRVRWVPSDIDASWKETEDQRGPDDHEVKMIMLLVPWTWVPTYKLQVKIRSSCASTRCHVPCSFKPHLYIDVDSGTFICLAAPDLDFLSRCAPVLSYVPWHWVSPLY